MLRLNLILVPLLGLGALMLVLGLYRGRAQNYPAHNHPGFTGTFSTKAGEPGHPISVVSYNIQFGENLSAAVNDLQSNKQLNNADLLLLQEMDEVGTALIAKQLGYNYIYFPSAVHPRSGRNFGNAILARGPIIETEKLVLPHLSWLTGILRTTTRATVELGGQQVQVYSVHNEYFLRSQAQRSAQIQALLADINPSDPYVIIGGDFNTFATYRVDQLVQQMAGSGFKQALEGDPPTVSKLFFQAPTDHLFVRGFTIMTAGTVPHAAGSDHFPIYTELAIDPFPAETTFYVRR